MRRLCMLFVLTVTAGASWTASAVPISAYGGTLDATLRFFDIQHNEDFSFNILLLRAEYELGVDFMPGVPLSFQQGSTPYSACVMGGPSAYSTACLGVGTPILATGEDPFSRFGSDPSQLGDLSDACAPDQLLGFGGHIAMIARGSCAFTTKWENAQTGGFSGVLVENNVPGPVAGFASLASTTSLTIPFFLISQAVADQIRTGTVGYLLDGRRDGNLYFPAVVMSVSWTPPPETPVDPEPVPEPSTILLTLLGLGCLIVRRRATS